MVIDTAVSAEVKFTAWWRVEVEFRSDKKCVLHYFMTVGFVNFSFYGWNGILELDDEGVKS